MDDINTKNGVERRASHDASRIPRPPGSPPDHDWQRLVGVGDVHAGADNLSSALEYYERAVALARESGTPQAEVVLIELKIVDCLVKRGQHGAALEFVRDLAERVRDFDEFIRACVDARLGQVLGCLNKYDEARVRCAAAYRVLRHSSANQEIGAVELSMGAVEHMSGRIVEAGEHYENALVTFRRIDDREGIARALNNLGTLLINTPRWAEAKDYFTRAISVAEEAGNYGRISSLCLNLGILCYKTGEWELSSKYLARALVISKETAPARIIRVHLALGIMRLRKREFAVAESHFNQIRELSRESGYRREEALALEFLGDKSLREGNLDLAKERLDEALAIVAAVAPGGDVEGEVRSRLAELALARGDFGTAEAEASASLAIADRILDSVEAGRCHRILGEVASGRGDFTQAEQSLRRAKEIVAATPDVLERAHVRFAEAKFIALRSQKSDTTNRTYDPSAIVRFEEVVTSFLELELPELAVRTIMTVAEIRVSAGVMDEALVAIDRAWELAERFSVIELRSKLETLRSEIEECCAEESLTRSAEYQLLQEVSGFGTSDPEGLVRAYLQLACQRAQGDRAVLALRSRGEELRIDCTHGFAEGTAPKRPLLSMVLSELEAGRRIHVVNDPRHDQRYTAFPQLTEEISAAVAIPVQLPAGTVGVLYIDRFAGHAAGSFRSSDLRLLSFFAAILSVFLTAREGERRHRPDSLGTVGEPEDAYAKFITCSDEMRRSMMLLRKLDRSDAGVLVTGETGTGKGLLAGLIHEASRRSGGSFVPVNCAALPETLLESELFGHEQGAFTGAIRTKRGLFEEAEGGTLFLDEVDKAPLSVQGKLLHVLDKHEIRPVGSTEWRLVDVRVICATNVNLREAINQGRFLEDLYYRLNDFQVHIPPLRERREDIPLLIRAFVTRFQKDLKRRSIRFSRDLIQTLTDHEWRGNVRELEKVVKRLVVLADEGETIGPDLLPPEIGRPTRITVDQGTLKGEIQKLEAQLIGDCLRSTAGNKSEVARRLRISYPSLLSKIKAYGLEPKRRRIPQR